MKRNRLLFVPILFLLLLPQCFPAARLAVPPSPTPGTSQLYPTRLPPAKQYAGEVLSYMIQVVTGTAGRDSLRDAWRQRGVNSGLTLPEIAAILHDPEQDKNRLMIFDMNVRGLSQVVYYYDPRLNQFKGAHSIDGIYPSAELIALRLLLVDLIYDGRQVDLPAFHRLISMLMDPAVELPVPGGDASGLSAVQIALIRSVLRSEPDLAEYLRHPFLVAAFNNAGVLKPGAAVQKMVRQAGYRQLRAQHVGSQRHSGCTVAILPSMTKAFFFESGGNNDGAYGFFPNGEYLKAEQAVKTEIFRAVERRLRARIESMPAAQAETETESPEPSLSNQIEFLDFSRRPLVVYPGNASRVIGDLCPDADVVVILMGKNVDRSIQFPSEGGTTDAAPQFYLDIMDVKWGRVDDEVAQIAEVIAEKWEEQ